MNRFAIQVDLLGGGFRLRPSRRAGFAISMAFLNPGIACRDELFAIREQIFYER